LYSLIFNDNTSAAKAILQVVKNSIRTEITSTSTVPLNQWSYLAGTFDGSQVALFFNSVSEATAAFTGPIDQRNTTTLIGGNQSTAANKLIGKIDEVRLSSKARSADWLALSYQNQIQNQTVVEFGEKSEMAGAPGITAHPQSATRNTGQSVTFSVQASGNPTPSFTWLKDNEIIPDSARSELALLSLTLADSGVYQAIAYNDSGADTSNGATLTMRQPVSISSQPHPASKLVGDSVHFTVAADGYPAPSYKWLKADSVIPGQQQETLVLTGLSLGDSGAYRVVVYNDASIDTSDTAWLTMNQLPGVPHIETDPNRRWPMREIR
jgi:hypothetical protein